MKDVFAFHLGVKLSKGKIIGYLRLCPIPIYLPQISSQLFLILQIVYLVRRKPISELKVKFDLLFIVLCHQPHFE